MNNETKTRKIYVYSTSTYLKKGWLKIGETHQTVEERVKQQDGTACPEPLLVLDQWPSPEYSDKDIHAILRKMKVLPVREDTSREWYACTLDQVKAAYNRLTQGVARPNNYSMRPEQQDCCDKIVGHFNNGGERFLMNAKMRFGKTFTSYQAAKAMGFKKILVLTYKPSVFDSWCEDLEQHVDFDGWSASQAKSGEVNFNDPTVVFESFQQLLNGGKTDDNGDLVFTGVKKKASSGWIYDIDWDLVILDEEHYGMKTPKATEVLDALAYSHQLKLSGTPYKTLASGEYSDEEIFSWRYVDEQKKKNEGSEPHQCMPTMKFHTFNIHPSVIKEAADSGYNEEDGFRIEKMFAAENNSFKYPSAVEMFLSTIGKKRVKGQSWSPYQADNISNRLLDHMLWMLPMSIDSVTALCDMLREHPNFEDYEIINASGNNTVNIEDVKEAIERNTKTITVSCGRFDTGVTVPEWKTVIMLDGSKSPEKYFQTIFRAQSPLKGHKECLVIDFNPQRLLELVYDYCSITAKASDSTEKAIREFLEVASLLEHGENDIVERKVGDVMMAMSRSGNLSDRFGSARNICSNSADERLLEALADLSATKVKKIEVLLGSTNEVEKGKVSRTLTQREKTDLKKVLDDIKEKAQTALRRIPTYLFITTDIEQNCDDIVEKGSDSDLFEEVTGISADIFGHALDIGFLDRSSLNRSIADFGYRESQITLNNFLTQD
jgi:superfamily II DNA or RNA helicase